MNGFLLFLISGYAYVFILLLLIEPINKHYKFRIVQNIKELGKPMIILVTSVMTLIFSLAYLIC